MRAATLSTKFQICIPKEVREEMHLSAGQKFIFIPKGKVIHMVPQGDIKSIRGIMKGANTENYRDHKDRF